MSQEEKKGGRGGSKKKKRRRSFYFETERERKMEFDYNSFESIFFLKSSGLTIYLKKKKKGTSKIYVASNENLKVALN